MEGTPVCARAGAMVRSATMVMSFVIPGFKQLWGRVRFSCPIEELAVRLKDHHCCVEVAPKPARLTIAGGIVHERVAEAVRERWHLRMRQRFHRQERRSSK